MITSMRASVAALLVHTVLQLHMLHVSCVTMVDLLPAQDVTCAGCYLQDLFYSLVAL